VTVTAQPRDRSVSIAGCPVPAEGADPPDWANRNVPVEIPDVTSETSIPSMLAWSRAVLSKAPKKSPPCILSKALAGKLVSEEQLLHAIKKLVTLDVSSNGKLVSDEQPLHAWLKLVALEVLIRGKLVSEEQCSMPC